MPTYISFGDSLKTMLAILDISINRLSKAINVDSSLVNRWIHGKRIPAYHTSYIENISEYLSKNIQNSFQMQHINELCLNVCKECDPEDGSKKIIKSALLEAQGYSLERKNYDNNANANQNISKEQISATMDSINEMHGNAAVIADSVSISAKIICGIENILSAGISLLRSAISLETDQMYAENKTIYITFNNDLDITANNSNELSLLRELCLKALDCGWHSVLLLGLSYNTDRNQRLISYLLPLIRNRQFHLYYFKKYDSNKADRGIFVVPGVGALSCFPCIPPSDVCHAFYLESKTGVDILNNYLTILQKTCTKPLIKHCSGEKSSDSFNRLMESGEGISGRLLLSCYFSVSLLPEDLFMKLLRRKYFSNDEFDLYKSRLNEFHVNIQHYEYKHIYFSDSIIDLVKKRQYCFYSYSGVKIIDLEAEDVSQFLHNIINLLEAYENYNIAFIPQSPDNSLKKEDFCFLVKERRVVLLEAYKPETSAPDVRLSIDEPMVVSAFNVYFKNIWEEIAPVNKNRREVIAWLKIQIAMLNT